MMRRLMPRSEMVEIPRPFIGVQDKLQAKKGFVMPAKAGIHLHFWCSAKKNLDSGLRRNDGTESRLLVDEFRIPRLKAEGCSVLLMVLISLVCAAAVHGAQPTKLRFSYSSRSNSIAPFQIALTKGFFAEEGMDVEMIQINPRLGATALLNGDIDFTTTFGTTLRGVIGGFPIKFVAVSVRKSEHFLIVRPEIKELRELVGKKLGVATLFGSDQRAAEEMVRGRGFSPNIMKPVAVGEAPVRAQALRAGVVDAIAVSSPFDLSLQAEGFRALAGPKDVEMALPTSGIAVASRLLQQNPQHVKRAVRALMKAHRFVFDNRKETVAQMIRYLEQKPEVAERSYDILSLSLSRNGEITDQEWDLLTEKKKPVDEVRDFTLLREVQKELKIR
ncbi:MAG: ABC transporter substrate-binding protein [Deltaproteobacteria bacterium]|nr:ABC transporter substrate-binding protein [Deltaproteobacteria bacterium]